MKFLWFNKISLTANAYVIIHKYIRYLVNKFTPNNYLVVGTFLWRELHLSTFKNWNHPPYLWQNFIFIYLMKLIRMLAPLRHILVFIFNLLLQNKWYLHSWQSCGITLMVSQSSIFLYQLFIYYRVLLYNFILLLKDQ